jgi:hypothetical protein
VELGKYLCEVRAGQCWLLENLESFDEFLERRFPDSRRKAYYLMSIHEHLPPLAAQGKQTPKAEFQREVEKELTGTDGKPSVLIYFN